MKLLTEILSLRRPHGGRNELFLAEGILARLPGELLVFNDTAGNPMAFVYTTDPDSTTLFTAHVDTVHREDGHNPVIFDEELEWMSKADGLPLGADDGAGVWLLYRMAEAGVPGTYLFPAGEERGGVGSKWMAENAALFLGKFTRAIAFDRKGVSSVITHQFCGRCCSNEFAQALSEELTTTIPGGYVFEPDDTGVYTDTADFISDIAECTNISVGYWNEHTGNETLDVGYLKALLAACLLVDWEALPVVRDPSYVEPVEVWNWRRSSFGRGNDVDEADADLLSMTEEEIYDFVYYFPEEAAEMLIDFREMGR